MKLFFSHSYYLIFNWIISLCLLIILLYLFLKLFLSYFRPLCKSPWLRGPQWKSPLRPIRLILRPVNEPSKSIRWFTKISCGLTTCGALKLASSNWRASCQAANHQHSRVSVVTNLQNELPPLKFDWDRFLEMLYPLSGYIICAVIVSIY